MYVCNIGSLQKVQGHTVTPDLHSNQTLILAINLTITLTLPLTVSGVTLLTLLTMSRCAVSVPTELLFLAGTLYP